MSTTIKVPNELYEKIKELANKENKPMWEIIKNAIDRIEVGDIQINLPKPKFINLKYPTWCVLGNHKLDPQKYREERGRELYALWFPGINGVVCIDCLIKHVFTQETQAKTLAKLEVEVRKLKAIKNELSKEVEELAIKYSFSELLMGVKEVIEAIDSKLRILNSIIHYYLSENGVNEEQKLKDLKELKASLEDIKKKLEKLEMPSSWLKKGIEKMSMVVKKWEGKE